ncbi:MAG TPA: DUF721 domain-containing protein [Candidatus Corynebacterium gallistercoris]|uniref:DUF721 domain-containing protein n=1 Tax=Candidatus Corynebacterium gallistercoris TaxID=2838530 RepID=A0A9D1RYS6_9CORY|nr:DUF721 domain-containing protein [Candidatus Corynebacterium gallistercoris]
MTIDPVAEAFANLRKTSGNPQGEWKGGVASPPKKKKHSKPARIPTRADGRADRSYRDPKPFHDLVQREIRRQGWHKQFSVHKLMNAWEELVGEKVAEHTRPVKFEEETKRLVVQCDSTPWTTQLRYMQKSILQSLARQLGPDVVAELNILGPHIPRQVKGRLRVKGRGPRDDFG